MAIFMHEVLPMTRVKVMLIFNALEALMTVNGALPINVKVLLEGEEEGWWRID